MASRMVNDRERSGRSVVQSARTHREAVAARIAKVLGGDAASWGGVLDALAGSIEATMTTLIETEAARDAERADDGPVREQRDGAATSLRTTLLDFRASADAVYGPAGPRALGLDGATPTEPIALLRLAQHAAGRVGELAALEPVRRGLQFDAAVYGPLLTEQAAALDSALGEVTREGRELEATQVAKDAAMAAHDARFIAAARTIEGLFTLAGEAELSRRVRPSVRRPGQTVELAEDPDEPASDAL